MLNAHGIQIGYGVIAEDLGFGLTFAFGRSEISKKIGT